MPDYGLTSYKSRHLTATSTTLLYEWYTNWQSCDGIDNIRAVLKTRNAAASNFQWQPAIQYAAYRPDEPGSPAALRVC